MVNSRSSSVWNLSLSPKAVRSIIDGIWIFKVEHIVEMVDTESLSDMWVACFRRFPIYVTGWLKETVTILHLEFDVGLFLLCEQDASPALFLDFTVLNKMADFRKPDTWQSEKLELKTVRACKDAKLVHNRELPKVPFSF
jgi:hypothetical protein